MLAYYLEHKFLRPILFSYDLSLKFLRRFVDSSGIYVINGYTRMSLLVLVSINSNLSANLYSSIICLQASCSKYGYLLVDLLFSLDILM